MPNNDGSLGDRPRPGVASGTAAFQIIRVVPE